MYKERREETAMQHYRNRLKLRGDLKDSAGRHAVGEGYHHCPLKMRATLEQAARQGEYVKAG